MKQQVEETDMPSRRSEPKMGNKQGYTLLLVTESLTLMAGKRRAQASTVKAGL
jgi:hypothetical protein